MRRRSPRPLGGLVGVGATVWVMGCGATPTPPPTPSAGVSVNGQLRGASGAPGDGDVAVQPLRFDDMDTERADPTTERRNPFRFGTRRVAEPPGAPRTPPAPVVRPNAAAPEGEAPMSAAREQVELPAAIPLTFLGFMESPGIEGRVVILSDGDNILYGRRGEVIDGRYRIVSLGLESVVVERIDGEGQATLSLPNDASDGV